ncbi:YveK family protein [Paenibacillus sp. GXUN7292]|uniref:YveK family protein n=1 Tax=Paenibacillus sp. GXUN7292 TaxID=3422499 RepID=UPI003D7E7493
MSNELDLKQLFHIIKKRFMLIVLTVAVATVAVALFSKFYIQPKYEASTKIIVNQTANQVATGQIDLNQINSSIRMIDTYKEIIRTPAIMGKVVEQYPHLDLTLQQLVKKVKVSSVNNTQVMTLNVQDTSYKKAAQIVNAVSDVFSTEIIHIFQVENVSILNYADENESSASPVSPNVKLNTAIAFVVSLMLMVGLAFLLEMLDDTIKTEEDVMEHLGLPTLASIIKVDTEGMGKKQPAKKSSYKVGELERVTIDK